jgi:hypothetical protein
MTNLTLAGRRAWRRAVKYRLYVGCFLAGLLLRDSVRVVLALCRLFQRVRRGLELVEREQHIAGLLDVEHARQDTNHEVFP